MPVTGSTKPNKPYIIGVAGGSGSGKTYFARELQRWLGNSNCEIVYQDNFYIDQSAKFDFDGGSVNFDHPDSIDSKLLARHLAQLKSGAAVEIPIYDFATHKRRTETLTVRPVPVVLVDGILIFHWPEVRALFDEMVFFDTPEELRFQRRLERDVKERGRTPTGVQNQFNSQVKPMHDQFVEPSKSFATTVVREQGDFNEAIKSFLMRLKGAEILKVSGIKRSPVEIRQLLFQYLGAGALSAVAVALNSTVSCEATRNMSPKDLVASQFDIVSVIEVRNDFLKADFRLWTSLPSLDQLCRAMHGQHANADLPLLESMAAELLNMIYGYAKSNLNDDKGFQLPPAIPKLMRNREFGRIRRSEEIWVMPVRTPMGTIYVEVDFTPA
jgi:uridine kinase